MPYEIVMPRLGWNMEEGTLVEWLKQDGEKINQGEMVCTIEGDKAATDVESFETGILKIPDACPLPGHTVPVGTLLGYIVSESEVETFDPNQVRVDGGTGENLETVPAGGTDPGPAGKGGSEQNGPRVNAASVSECADSPTDQGAPAISPRARRAAQEAGIDWRSLTGSGRSGRIVERDVRDAVAGQVGGDSHAQVAGALTSKPVDRRGIIARRMAEAHRTTAPVTLNTEVDVTALYTMFTEESRPSWYALMAKMSAVALAEHPVMNAAWRDGVVLNEGIHIGIGVDTPEGVIVPVVRDVPGKSVQDVAEESRRLIQDAQNGKLKLDQIEGGTFTLTNLGMYGIDAFTPIIHLPQCAILGMGRVTPRVVVLDETSASTGIRRIMTLSLTFDHRIVDGAPAARFLQRIKRLVEQPAELFKDLNENNTGSS